MSNRADARLIVRSIGNLNVLSPALTLSVEEIGRIVAILRDAIKATMAEFDREGFDFAAQAGPSESDVRGGRASSESAGIPHRGNDGE